MDHAKQGLWVGGRLPVHKQEGNGEIEAMHLRA